ncbi:hypothetical protein QE379_003722 [Sphingomonas sp. SORGH_AS 879]|nr:hypothetical protein [Sphingomonas sp. SORGH_AS_0879]
MIAISAALMHSSNSVRPRAAATIARPRRAITTTAASSNSDHRMRCASTWSAGTPFSNFR